MCRWIINIEGKNYLNIIFNLFLDKENHIPSLFQY